LRRGIQRWLDENEVDEETREAFGLSVEHIEFETRSVRGDGTHFWEIETTPHRLRILFDPPKLGEVQEFITALSERSSELLADETTNPVSIGQCLIEQVLVGERDITYRDGIICVVPFFESQSQD
jgi:hypothetical protein